MTRRPSHTRATALLFAALAALTSGCTVVEGHATAIQVSQPPPLPPPTFSIPTSDKQCTTNPYNKGQCLDWTRPPGPVPPWPMLMNWAGSSGQEIGALYAVDYLCGLIPDAMVRTDFGPGGYRYLVLTPACVISTRDTVTMHAAIYIGIGGGIDTWQKDVPNTIPITVDGRMAVAVQSAPTRGTADIGVFLAIPRFPDNVLVIDVMLDATYWQNASEPNPLPGVTPDDADAYAERVFQDIAAIFVAASQ
jgi:hypothetical protein